MTVGIRLRSAYPCILKMFMAVGRGDEQRSLCVERIFLSSHLQVLNWPVCLKASVVLFKGLFTS